MELSVDAIEPPKSLSDPAKTIWRRVVKDEPALLFRTEAARITLGQYCEHIGLAQSLSADISKLVDAETLLILCRLRAFEEAAALKCATSLRMTNQSRVDKKTAGTASRKKTPAAAERKPWEAE